MTVHADPSRQAARPALALLLAIALVACEGEAQQAGGEQAQPPPSVRVAEVDLRSVEVREQYAGRARGARAVEVRARVEGMLEHRGYVEGSLVERGDPLVRIDREPYKAATDRAQAELQRAQAALRRAERDRDRVVRLYEDNAVSTRERDEAQSALELARADLALARAGVRSAEIELGYTDIEAPLAGVTSLEALPEGSLVSPGDLLTTVTQLDPIHVRFALPERDALAQREARRAMTDGERAAILHLPNGKEYREQGVVNFTDASIDPDTGTVRARAAFPIRTIC